MKLPRDLENLILEYYVSMLTYELQQKVKAKFQKNSMLLELRSFHTTTHIAGRFSPKFCLAVIYYMNSNHMFMMI